MLFQKIIFFKRKLNTKCIQFALFHFLNNQQLMKIVFTSSYKIYFKDNTKNDKNPQQTKIDKKKVVIIGQRMTQTNEK